MVSNKTENRGICRSKFWRENISIMAYTSRCVKMIRGTFCLTLLTLPRANWKSPGSLFTFSGGRGKIPPYKKGVCAILQKNKKGVLKRYPFISVLDLFWPKAFHTRVCLSFLFMPVLLKKAIYTTRPMLRTQRLSIFLASFLSVDETIRVSLRSATMVHFFTPVCKVFFIKVYWVLEISFSEHVWTCRIQIDSTEKGLHAEVSAKLLSQCLFL